MKFLVTEPDKIQRSAEILAESKSESRMDRDDEYQLRPWNQLQWQVL